MPGEFSRWPLRIEMDGLREDYARDVLAVLRGSLTDLRFAVGQDMQLFLMAFTGKAALLFLPTQSCLSSRCAGLRWHLCRCECFSTKST